MKIVVAIDSFKGSATSEQLGAAAQAGVLQAAPDAQVVVIPIADGGEGTLDALQAGLGGSIITVDTIDLLGRPIEAPYLLVNDGTGKSTAIIEAAHVVGIDKITPSPQTIMEATTEGLAALFLDARDRGVSEIVLSLGGTGTSDGGLGLLYGLGARGKALPVFDGDLDLSGLASFDGITITALADVTNFYAGPDGFARFFGPQKGGTDEINAALDDKSRDVAAAVKAACGVDIQSIPGTGAAGGLGGAVAVLGAHIEPGFTKIAGLLNIEAEIAGADLVLTGEGRMDFQTANGKVPYGMAMLAANHQVPTIALCGAVADNLGDMDKVLLAAFSIQQSALPLAEAMDTQRTLANLTRTVRNIIATRTGQ
ncbi:MAG: glycerate kinase [Cellulomonadaceae bacterium]|jgi:glycerate kinase|nr:glycerate kinase [Cellulomonadaceae bacterium]